MIKIKKYPSKKAFSMVTAIFVIVIMASVSSLIMNVTGKTIKETTQQYQKEQASLLARSYTEQALLYALHYDRNLTRNCINQINATFGPLENLYTIQTNIQYASNVTQIPNPNAGCNTIGATPWGDSGDIGFNSSVSLLIDVYVSYQDFDDPTADRNITFHRRTLQKL